MIVASSCRLYLYLFHLWPGLTSESSWPWTWARHRDRLYAASSWMASCPRAWVRHTPRCGSGNQGRPARSRHTLSRTEGRLGPGQLSGQLAPYWGQPEHKIDLFKPVFLIRIRIRNADPWVSGFQVTYDYGNQSNDWEAKKREKNPDEKQIYYVRNNKIRLDSCYCMLFGTKKSERNNEPLHILTKKNLNVQIPLGTGTNKKVLSRSEWTGFNHLLGFVVPVRKWVQVYLCRRPRCRTWRSTWPRSRPTPSTTGGGWRPTAWWYTRCTSFSGQHLTNIRELVILVWDAFPVSTSVLDPMLFFLYGSGSSWKLVRIQAVYSVLFLCYVLRKILW